MISPKLKRNPPKINDVERLSPQGNLFHRSKKPCPPTANYQKNKVTVQKVVASPQGTPKKHLKNRVIYLRIHPEYDPFLRTKTPIIKIANLGFADLDLMPPQGGGNP